MLLEFSNEAKPGCQPEDGGIYGGKGEFKGQKFAKGKVSGRLQLLTGSPAKYTTRFAQSQGVWRKSVDLTFSPHSVESSRTR
jgi:hypothetical protein